MLDVCFGTLCISLRVGKRIVAKAARSRIPTLANQILVKHT